MKKHINKSPRRSQQDINNHIATIRSGLRQRSKLRRTVSTEVETAKTAKKPCNSISRTKQHPATTDSKPKTQKTAKPKVPVRRVGPTNQTPISSSVVNAGLGLPELPIAAMPGLIGEVVQAACNHSEVHPISVVVNFLLRFATYFCTPYYSYGSISHYCRTNAVIIGKSARGSIAASSSEVDRIFEGIPYNIQFIRGNMLSGESLIEAVSDNKHNSDDWDRQGSSSVPYNLVKCLLYNELDIRSALAYAKRPGNPLSQTVCGLFNYGCAEQILRSGKISTKAAHVNILAQTRSIDFSSLKKDVENSNEFASYFLWFLVDRLKVVPHPKPIPDDKVVSFREIILERIRAAQDQGSMRMSKKARSMWNDIYPGLTKDVPGVAGAVVSRSEIHLIRLALIYAVIAGHKRIRPADLQSAHALVQYARESACIIFKGDQQGVNFAEKILCALHTAPGQELSRTEISGVFGRNAAAADINCALQKLEELKRIAVERKESTSDRTGRKKTFVRLI